MGHNCVMIIRIDFREASLIEKMKIMTDCKVEVLNLMIGDIEIYDDLTDTVVAIIERKTVDDLASSIKDGRYKEQSYRLAASSVPVYYLIEGAFKSFNMSLPKKTLISAMCSLSIKFRLLRTDSITDTADVLILLSKKLLVPVEKNQQQQQEHQQPEQAYTSVIKSVKKENITPEIFGAIVLCQIPGVSSKTATAIIDHYKSLNNLLADSDKKITLSNLCIQKRKISKTVIDNVIKFLENM